MNIQISSLATASPAADIRLVVNGSDLGLYGATLQARTGGEPSPQRFALVLSLQPVSGPGTSLPATISLPCHLSVPPAWDFVATGNQAGEAAYAPFGGGWSILADATVQGTDLTPAYGYDVEETDLPRFVLNTSQSPASQQFLSAIFSGYQFGLIGLQEQDGVQVPHVSGIVGTSTTPVIAGRAFGDLSSGLPSTLSVVYLTGTPTGSPGPGGNACGALSLASYDINANTLGAPVALADGVTFSDFDLATSGSTLCLLGVTGSGAPFVALYDMSGTLLEGPASPVGSWSNAGHWVASPSVVSTPGGSGFTIAFVDMQDQSPAGIYTGTVTPATPTP